MNIQALRNETAGCHDKIFLNSAGSSLMPDVVVKKMINYLHDEQMQGGYYLADQYETEKETLNTEVAKLINCREENIAFAESATQAYSKALSSIPFNEGDVIVTSENDYVSNQLSFLSLAKRFGVKVKRCRHLSNGDIDLEDIQKLINEKPILVAITHIPTNSGLVQQVAEIGKMCKNMDVLYLVDACQSLGQMCVDVQELQCDFLTATGRKFLRGPRGTGFLFVSDKVLRMGLHPLFFDQYGANWSADNEFDILPSAKRFENWEKNYATLLGLKEAIGYINAIGIVNIQERNMELQQYFRSCLAEVKNILVRDEGSKLCNIITITKTDNSIAEIKTVMDLHNVHYSISGNNGAVIDFKKKKIEAVVRFSPHYFNTKEELERVTDLLCSL